MTGRKKTIDCVSAGRQPLAGAHPLLTTAVTASSEIIIIMKIRRRREMEGQKIKT